MKDKISVHVADDHKILIEGLIAVIKTEENLEVSGYSLTGKQVIDWFETKGNHADILILDITMPELDGFEVLKHFQRKRSNQKVIMLSSYDDIKIVDETIKLGAYGYISKGNAGEHIVKAIKRVASGRLYYSDDIQSLLLKRMTGAKIPVGDAPEDFLFEKLSDREKEVLRLVTLEYSTSEIADSLSVSHHTVETYRRKMLKKLNVKSSVGLAMYAVKFKVV
ncbi:response regulator transcription factor [Polaribacter aestuariivivens]|uniref:Response regulator transcription factor n=1 Tax=Polaribacter aestuariivivens TaxID=2304626 RepID=A0A5S3N9U2_9FLAO|nr:response regulator transcription factor [Polaribacter aestuariivivens]TMM32078.1 response regulator transcription factor [Polaribacter aestuariivivens]